MWRQKIEVGKRLCHSLFRLASPWVPVIGVADVTVHGVMAGVGCRGNRSRG